MDEASTVSVTLVIVDENVVKVTYKSRESKNRETYLLAPSV